MSQSNAIIAILKASPFFVLGGFIAFISLTDDHDKGAPLGTILGVGTLFLGLRSLCREIYLCMGLTFRDGRVFLTNRIPLASCQPSSLLVKFDAHSVWKTYLICGEDKILISSAPLDAKAQAWINEIASSFDIPIFQKDLFSKLVRVRWKKSQTPGP